MTYHSQHEIDEVDWRILKELQEDARLSYSEIGRRVNLSQPAVAERVRRLEEVGVIRGYHADIDAALTGKPVSAFIRIRTQMVNKLEAHIRQETAITEGHRITGDDCVLLKVQVASIGELGQVIDRLAIFGVPNTSVVLSTIVER